MSEKLKIKVIGNYTPVDGKRQEFVEEEIISVDKLPEKNESTKISNIIKEMFEDALDTVCIVKTRIRNGSVVSSVTIRPPVA